MVRHLGLVIVTVASIMLTTAARADSSSELPPELERTLERLRHQLTIIDQQIELLNEQVDTLFAQADATSDASERAKLERVAERLSDKITELVEQRQILGALQVQTHKSLEKLE